MSIISCVMFGIAQSVVFCLEICALLGYYAASSGNPWVKGYHSTLSNIPEKRRSHVHRGGSQKSQVLDLLVYTAVTTRLS